MTLIYFVLILGITVFIHELGHFLMAKKNGVYCYEFSLGMGPKIYSFNRKNDETTYSIRLFPIGGFVQMAGEDIEEEEDIPKNKQMQSKTIWQRFVIVLAGVFNNFVLGFVLLFLMALIYGSVSQKPVVTSVDSKYNAYKVNVREGDTILKVNGKRTRTLDDVILEITLTKQGDAIKLDLVDKDNNKKSVSVLPTKVENEDGSESYIYGLGWGGEPEKGLIPSFKYATQKFSSLFRSMGKIIVSLFTGRLGLDSLSGPVGIYQVVGEQRKAGFENIIYLTAYISINVGFVNLIPFPAFDGGRALFLIIEKIRKKPVKREVENTIHSIGFVLLMILVVVITIKDVIKLF
ncbi:MAG: M50 family metallopeptidase [bacterium]|nr:M50 family metallopeptidase [bacterium]MDY4108272.1 M50 family metallopeptidase [Bacilli bacterium]